MKLTLLFVLYITALGNMAHAQSTMFLCDGDPAPPGGCGYYNGSGEWVFTKCFLVNCQGDPNNCGGVGNKCSSATPECENGSCLCDGSVDPSCDPPLFDAGRVRKHITLNLEYAPKRDDDVLDAVNKSLLKLRKLKL